MCSVYKKYGLKPVINASGRMTILGVSTPDECVIRAVNEGLSHYFEMCDLTVKTGQHIAGLLGCEDAVIVSCASAGIAQAIAGVIVKDDRWLLENLHSAPLQVPHEIVMAKGHNVNFGAPVATMVALGGGRLKEAGYANECSAIQLAAAITPQTAAILYIKSHHCVQKSHLSVEQAVAVAREHQLPLIVDAAAEEDLRHYYQCGADLVIYSGAKAIEGPTSGLVIGRRQPVGWVRQQSAGIGRAMKVGKEGILGLCRAIEHYLQREKIPLTQMEEKMAPFICQLNRLQGIRASVAYDAAGREIARTKIQFDEAVIGLTTEQILQQLKSGETAIYFRGYKANEGSVEVDVRSVSPLQLDLIYQHIKALLAGEKILCP